MKKSKIATLFLLSCIIFSGCAKRASVTYHSNPSGAELRENGQFLGYAPLTLNYIWKPNAKNGPCSRLTHIDAIWISGAKTSTKEDPTTICESGSYNMTLQRLDDDLEGEVQDIAFAKIQQKERAREKQVRQVQQKYDNAAALIFLGAATAGSSYYNGRAARMESQRQASPTYDYYQQKTYLEPLPTTPPKQAYREPLSIAPTKPTYTGLSGKQYKYDMNNPIDKIHYDTDISAQMDDQTDTDPRRDIDEYMGQKGGGATGD